MDMQGPSYIHAEFTARQPATGFAIDGRLDPADGALDRYLRVVHPPGFGSSGGDGVAVGAGPARRPSFTLGRRRSKERKRAAAPPQLAKGGDAPPQLVSSKTVMSSSAGMARVSSQGIEAGDTLAEVDGHAVPFHKVVIPVDTLTTSSGATPLGITLASGGPGRQVYVAGVNPAGLAAKHGVRPGWALLSFVETWPFGGDEPDVFVHGQRTVSHNIDVCVARLQDACAGRAHIVIGGGDAVHRLRFRHEAHPKCEFCFLFPCFVLSCVCSHVIA
jgi:hypothetical protein